LEHNQGLVIEEQAVVIDLNALASLDNESSEKSKNGSKMNGVGDEMAGDVQIVLALQVPLVNFSVDEI
jgi:hypothetical protein